MDDFAWEEYTGFIVKETDLAIGIGHSSDDVDVWVPRSQLSLISYANGGDSDEIRVGDPIEGIEVSEWWLNKWLEE